MAGAATPVFRVLIEHTALATTAPRIDCQFSNTLADKVITAFEVDDAATGAIWLEVGARLEWFGQRRTESAGKIALELC